MTQQKQQNQRILTPAERDTVVLDLSELRRSLAQMIRTNDPKLTEGTPISLVKVCEGEPGATRSCPLSHRRLQMLYIAVDYLMKSVAVGANLG